MIKTTNPPIRALGIILMFLLSLGIKAQTPNTALLTWDQEVGCIRYDDDANEIPGNGEAPPQTHVNLFENMMDGNCPRFCEGSTVTFTLQGSTIASVQWQATGGTLQAGSTNSNAVVQWGGNGNGSLTVTITFTDNTVKTYTICIEKIISPKAGFLIDGPDPYQQIFCTNTTISFNNISQDNGGSALVNYLWDFGDGNFSNAFEPTHTYASGGSYNIRLTVTNSCNCSSTYEYHIKVQDTKPIEISCLNVTCEFNIETYQANDSCGGDWEVVGGTIVGGGNGSSSVSVAWDQVDPMDGFGYISYRSYCNCPNWVTVKIPVVLKRAQLKGPSIICQGKQAKYSLPQWPTTKFDWRINGSPNHPMIVYTDQHNEIIVDGMAPGTYYIDVEYYNTLLDGDNCNGEIERFVFEVVENVSIIAPNERTTCTGAIYDFDSSNGQPVYWEIRTGGSVVHTSTGSNTSYTFNTGGTYVVTATYNGCTSEPVVIEVIPTPVISVGITGPAKVCLDVPYIYSIADNDPGAIFVWSVTGGTVIGTNAGSEVAIAFNNSTATVSVVKQYVKNGVICTSAPITYNVSEVVVNPTITNNSGLSIFCPSDKYTFTANLNGVEVDHLEWEIVGIQSPGNYTANFGNIINGINDLTVEVGLNEISNNVSNGELRLKVTKCGITVVKTVPIQLVLQPTLTLATLSAICPASNITLNLNSSAGGGDVYVNFGYGNTGPYTFTNGTPLSVPNGFSNTGASAITKTITLEMVGVCKYNPKVSQSVIVYPETTIEISPGYNYIVCSNTGFSPITLTANMFSGIGAPATYQWVKVGTGDIPGATGSSYTIQSTNPSPGGTYYVRVTNSFGCVITSDAIKVIESCGGSTGGCSTPPVNVTALWSTCNQITANVTYGGTPVSITWSGSQHLTLQSGQGTANAVFTTDVPGIHTAIATVDYGTCFTVETFDVAKNYEADLKTKVTCNANGTFNVELLNHSKLFNIAQNNITFTYSGSGITGSPTGQSYTVTGLAAGTHTFTLTLTSAGKPACTATATVVLAPAPNVNFSIPLPEYCSEEPVPLTIPGGYNSAYRYEWYQNGTHYKASATTTMVQFATGGQKYITLRITDANGCIYETAFPGVGVYINKAQFFGTVTPNMLDFCEGSTVTPLSFSPIGTSNTPTNAIWMRDDEQIATGLTFTPTESGSYWPVLIDGDGCKFYGMVNNPAIVTVRKPPFASINGNTSVCYGESTTLTGIFTDANVEHRWVGAGLPAGYNTWVTGANNISLPLNGLTPGNHNYAFETRHPSDPNCVNSFNAVVVFHPQLTTPSIGVGVTNCQPYTLQLTASGPAAGTYTWSNGMVGQTIQVTHGGAYSVTYTAPTGCSVTAQVQAPHNPERTLWVVPQGCYRICASTGAYLLAPLGVYQQYEWFVNGGTALIGNNTFVPNIMINQSGAYQLAIGQFGCMFFSNKPHIDLNYGCRPGTKSMQIKEVITPVQLTLSPNPATDVALASFNVGTQYQQATSIAVYDVTGVQRLQQKVSGKQGEVQLNVGYLPAGTYLVNLQADGVNIAQQKLIKK